MWRVEDEILVDFIHTYAVTLQRANLETCANAAPESGAAQGATGKDGAKPARCGRPAHPGGLGSAEPAKAGPVFPALMTGRTSWLPAA